MNCLSAIQATLATVQRKNNVTGYYFIYNFNYYIQQEQPIVLLAGHEPTPSSDSAAQLALNDIARVTIHRAAQTTPPTSTTSISSSLHYLLNTSIDEHHHIIAQKLQHTT
eukprot:6486108-Amphidinium_carterae.1